jgi:tagatose 1,6-diphosphate aldolase
LTFIVGQEKMRNEFRFRNPGRLVDGDLQLILVKRTPANPAKKHVPGYQFEMREVGGKGKIGRISLRIGSARPLQCPGHMGYKVSKRSRGNRYAARSIRLLFPLALAHGMKSVWITCHPKNMASRRTIELAGGRYMETIRTPKEHEMYAKGMRVVRRYRIDKKTMSNNALQHDAVLPAVSRRSIRRG